MEHQLNFKIRYQYQTTAVGIAIPTRLFAGNRVVEADSKFDPGADFCLFQREIAERLNLDVERGLPLRMSSLGWSFDTYGHAITMKFLGITIESTVFFAGAPGLSRNLLGRIGCMDRLLVGLDVYQEILYLTPTNEVN